jgi:predicted lactoylglutathione lyase
MIGYATLGTNDLDAAVSFYDELLSSIGATRIFDQDNFIAWSTGPAKPALAISRPYDGEQATVGNGVMIAIALDAPEMVDAFHAKAMELGGSDEGAPGPRGEIFYAAYFRDLDGNKLNAFCMTQK